MFSRSGIAIILAFLITMFVCPPSADSENRMGMMTYTLIKFLALFTVFNISLKVFMKKDTPEVEPESKDE